MSVREIGRYMRSIWEVVGRGLRARGRVDSGDRYVSGKAGRSQGKRR